MPATFDTVNFFNTIKNFINSINFLSIFFISLGTILMKPCIQLWHQLSSQMDFSSFLWLSYFIGIALIVKPGVGNTRNKWTLTRGMTCKIIFSLLRFLGKINDQFFKRYLFLYLFNSILDLRWKMTIHKNHIKDPVSLCQRQSVYVI